MKTLLTFAPKEGPLTIFRSILIGTVYLDQYQVHLRGYDVWPGLTRLDIPHNPCLEVPVVLPEFVVDSWSDWKQLLALTPGSINVGEGFEDDELSLRDFITLVEERASPRTLGRDGKPLSSPYDYIHRSKKEIHKLWTENPNWNWKDDEGYSFTTLLYA